MASKPRPTPTPRTKPPGAAAPAHSARAPNAPLLKRPLDWLQGLFGSHLRLERRGLQLHVVLAPASTVAPVSAFAESRGESLRLAHAALCDLLNHQPDTRHVMPHLSHLEKALSREGSRAIGRLPLHVLHRALTQLDSLIHDQPDSGLDDLQWRLQGMIEKRMNKRPSRDAAATDPDDLMEVSEASHSLFDEMERSWSGQIPQSAAATPAA